MVTVGLIGRSSPIPACGRKHNVQQNNHESCDYEGPFAPSSGTPGTHPLATAAHRSTKAECILHQLASIRQRGLTRTTFHVILQRQLDISANFSQLWVFGPTSNWNLYIARGISFVSHPEVAGYSPYSPLFWLLRTLLLLPPLAASHAQKTFGQSLYRPLHRACCTACRPLPLQQCHRRCENECRLQQTQPSRQACRHGRLAGIKQSNLGWPQRDNACGRNQMYYPSRSTFRWHHQSRNVRSGEPI